MGCGRDPVVRSVPGLGCPPVRLDALEETGRLHFFYHSPDSCLPVRDVLNRQRKGHKTEPYLEKSAENYCRPCIQSNIRGFLRSNEKYLFLLTKRSKAADDDRQRYVVGFLTKRRCLKRAEHLAVQGPIKLVEFAEAFPLKRLRGAHEGFARRGFKKLTKQQTGQLIRHFSKCHDIFPECLREVRRLKSRLAKDRRRANCSDTCGS
jgi:hypothetical protein